MKLLVFAHTPPPHHGQSYMVQLMLDGLGGDRRRKSASGKPSTPGADLGIQCYHVNARVSDKLQDIGDLRMNKIWRLFGHILQAIWYRYRYGVENLYYVPAPGKRSAIYRDWVVLILCRLFFKRVILHWHASGLAKWLETSVQPGYRSLTYRAARQADLSIVLSDYGRADAEKLFPLRVAVVGNGIPDPCPDFDSTLLARRRARLECRRCLLAGKQPAPELLAQAGQNPQTFRVLFLGHCTRAKGLFEAVEGALLAQRKLAEQKSPLRLTLAVGGEFVQPDEEAEFKRLCAENPGVVEHIGFVSGKTKEQWLREADVFCFPSHIESFGLVLVEAMAFGLPIVTTRAGALPEVMPAGYPGLVDVRRSDQIADALLRSMTESSFTELRNRFETRYTLTRFVERLAAAIKSVETQNPGLIGQPAEVVCG
jgi:glycosyltransferase involved in cell wall biosynthesis